MCQMKNQNKGKKTCETAVAFVTVVISRVFFFFPLENHYHQKMLVLMDSRIANRY